MELLVERWLPVRGYEGRYEVSDQGRVKSLKRFRRGRADSEVLVPEKIMKLTPKKRSASGRTLPYIEIRFRDGSVRTNPCKSFLVHRLVAQAFIGDLYLGAQVDHIDGDHQNNHYSNLRILSMADHSAQHPCIIDKERHAKMQSAAQAKIKSMRQAGEIVGRYKVLT